MRTLLVAALVLMASAACANDKGPLEKGPLVASRRYVHRVEVSVIVYYRAMGTGHQRVRR